MDDAQLLEEPRQAHVVGREPLATGCVGQRAGELVLPLPVAPMMRQFWLWRIHWPVASAPIWAPGAAIDVLQAGGGLDAGGLEQPFDALAIAQQALPIGQVCQAFLEADGGDRGLDELFFEGTRHAFQA